VNNRERETLMNALLRRGCVLLGLLPAVAAAEDKKEPTAAVGTVSGTITLDGKPLPAGFVTFHGPSGASAFRANIDGGKYATAGITAGRRYRLTVSTAGALALADSTRDELKRLEGRAQLLKQAKVDDTALTRRIKDLKERDKILQEMVKRLKDVKLPEKFTHRKTTPLAYEVKKGPQTFDIKLEK
jgi:hypothetical protein